MYLLRYLASLCIINKAMLHKLHSQCSYHVRTNNTIVLKRNNYMQNRNHHFYNPVYISASMANTLRLLISFTFLYLDPAFSQGNPADYDSVSDLVLQTDNDDKADSVRPVEAGAGGETRLEPKYRTRAESLFEWHAHILWENRYVTEGRDNLSGKGLVSVATEFTVDDFSVIPWIADSPGADYSEFNLNMVYGRELLEELEIYIGYNHIQARDSGDDVKDNEISLELAFNRIKRLHMLASIYHSFEADGSFMELAVKHGYRIDKSLHFSAQAILGVNAGYVTDGHDGLNHFQLHANIAYHPLSQMEI